MRGSYVLFTVQRYGESLGFENKNSYNEGAKFLKLCRDFPWQKHPYCKGIETVSIEKRQITQYTENKGSNTDQCCPLLFLDDSILLDKALQGL